MSLIPFADKSLKLVFVAACFAASCLVSSLANALPDDRDKPIHVKADSAQRDDKQGITSYRGDVIINQGSLNIIAQEVIMYGNDAVDKIVANGRPARLRQKPEQEKGVITAKGDHIEYSTTSEIVILKSNAFVEQDGTEVRGDQITYDMVRQVVSASGESRVNGGRVEMIIPPRKRQN